MTGLVVKIIILHGKDILLLQRSHSDSYKPSLWELPGGGVEINESIDSAAVREVKEETGLDVDIVKPLSTAIFEGTREPCVSITFLAVAKSKLVVISDEHASHEWRSIDSEFMPKIQNDISAVKAFILHNK